MVVAALPNFRLTSQTEPYPAPRWRFVREDLDGGSWFEASDVEPGASRQELELLALVRGLESLELPSRLSVCTASRYVQQGLVFGLPDWRRHGWCWESFGTLVPIKHLDLWQRVDHALQYHQLEGTQLLAQGTQGPGVGSGRLVEPLLRVHRLQIDRVQPAWETVRHMAV